MLNVQKMGIWMDMDGYGWIWGDEPTKPWDL
jgi:hypothetical protein